MPQTISNVVHVASNDYTEVMRVETMQRGETCIAFFYAAADEGLTFKVQGTVDPQIEHASAWLDVEPLDESGTPHADVNVPVGEGSAMVSILAPDSASTAAFTCYAAYRLMVKNTVADAVGTATASAFAK